MKKLLAIILTLVMVFSIVPFGAVTVGAQIIENPLDFLKYEIYDNEVEITYCDRSASGEIVIPNEIEGHPVTNIAWNAFSYCKNLTSIIISDSVTSIDDRAFRGCTNLTSVNIGKNVTGIGYGAFEECENLKNITIYDNISDLEHWIFNDTAYYNNENNWENSALYIGKYLIDIKENIKGDFKIKEGTLTISYNLFGKCLGIKSISLPKSLKNIGDSLYSYVENIERGKNNIEKIIVDQNNPYFSSDDTGVLFNKDKTVLINYPMGNKSEKYVIPNTVKTINTEAFAGSDVKEIYIPENVTLISNYAFACCKNLKNIWYAGDKNDKTNIDISEKSGWEESMGGYDNSNLLNATWHYNICDMKNHSYIDEKCENICPICGYTNSTDHDWISATCTKPAICKECDETKGEALGHDYEPATCTKAKTCTRCDKISGEKLGHDYEKATCTEPKTCKVCGRESGDKLGHTYEAKCEKATSENDGKSWKECTRCGKKKDESTINKIETVKLSTTSYTYNGKNKKPNIIIKDSEGDKISDEYYKITRPSSSKKVGEYTVKVKFKTKYSGTVKLTYTINPKKSSVSSVTAATKSLKVKIKKVSSQATGYEIQYSTSKKFTKSTTKTKKITSYKTTSATIKSLKAKKTYYVRVRTYKTVDGKKYYSDWSGAKSKKTK